MRNPAIETLTKQALSRWMGQTKAQIKAAVERSAGQHISEVVLGNALEVLCDTNVAVFIEGGPDDRPKWALV